MSFTLLLLFIGLLGGVAGAILAFLIGKIFLNKSKILPLIEAQKEKKSLAISQWFSSTFDVSKIIDPTKMANSIDVKSMVEPHIDLFLKEKLPQKMPMIAMFVGEKTITQLKEVFIGEIEQMFPSILNGALGNLKSSIDISTIIQQKIQSISTEQIYEWLKPLMSTIFKKLLILGFVIGFVVSYIVLIAVWEILIIA